ncbi:MAG: glycosyltransferase family A protein [Acidobacteriota bacterium]
MDISLIIPTHNRSRQLRETLRSVARIRYRGPWELIVVDNASTDDTARVIRDFVRDSHLNVCQAHESQRGTGVARNAGIAIAKGQLLAFMDDDCYPASDLLEEVCRLFSDVRLGYIGGRILLYDPSDLAITLREETTPVEIPPFSFLPTGLIQGANMAFRREAILSVGGFDPLFGAGKRHCCEDVDVAARASFAGWWGGYYPGPVVYHHHKRKCMSQVRAISRWYDRSRGAYYAKFILSRSTRSVYLEEWMSRLPSTHPRILWQELRGAFEYWLEVVVSYRSYAKRMRHSQHSRDFPGCP